MTGRPDRRELQRARTSLAARRDLVGDDDSRLFALLALEEIPESRLDELSVRLESALDALEATPIPVRRRTPRWAVAAIAASLLGLAALSWFLIGDGNASPDAVAQVDPPAAEPRATGADRVLPASAMATGVRLLEPGNARVVDGAVGEVRVVWIFDEALDL